MSNTQKQENCSSSLNINTHRIRSLKFYEKFVIFEIEDVGLNQNKYLTACEIMRMPDIANKFSKYEMDMIIYQNENERI